MPLKPPAPDPADYRRWKSRAAALLERQGLSLGVMLDATGGKCTYAE
jgi:hypothetical protein